MDWKMPAHEIVMLLLPSTNLVQTEYRISSLLEYFVEVQPIFYKDSDCFSKPLIIHEFSFLTLMFITS